MGPGQATGEKNAPAGSDDQTMASNDELASDDVSACAPSCDRYVQGLQEVEDLIELDQWDEETVVQNFRLRFLSARPYTAAGGVMIALNPCKNLDNIYDRDLQVCFFSLTGGQQCPGVDWVHALYNSCTWYIPVHMNR